MTLKTLQLASLAGVLVIADVATAQRIPHLLPEASQLGAAEGPIFTKRGEPSLISGGFVLGALQVSAGLLVASGAFALKLSPPIGWPLGMAAGLLGGAAVFGEGTFIWASSHWGAESWVATLGVSAAAGIVGGVAGAIASGLLANRPGDGRQVTLLVDAAALVIPGVMLMVLRL